MYVLSLCRCVVALHFGYFCFSLFAVTSIAGKKSTTQNYQFQFQVLNILFAIVAFAFVCVHKWLRENGERACTYEVQLQLEWRSVTAIKMEKQYLQQAVRGAKAQVHIKSTDKRGQFPQRLSLCTLVGPDLVRTAIREVIFDVLILCQWRTNHKKV